MQRPRNSASSIARRGFTTPLVAGVLLVAMLGLALVLDRLWLEAARVELTTTAEAAALAAAGQLVSDARLTEQNPRQELLNEATHAAVDIAMQNRVAGQPVVLDTASDIRFGHLVENAETGETPFLESPHLPTQVVITAHRTRFRGNPVALFLGELTNQPAGDVVARAGAGLSNRIIGVRPFDGATVPAVPLAIWQRDPTGQRKDTWDHCIEARQGRDEYRYDERTHSVIREADDIPELTLKTTRRGGPNTDANAMLLDIGSGFRSDTLARQFADGWTADDLAPWDGELRFPITLRGLPQLAGDDRNALEDLIGEQRIAVLYSRAKFPGRGPDCDATCERLVAIRILAVADQPNGACHVTVQPTVLTTRTAVLATAAEAVQDIAANPYIYRLQLTQ
ncbi:MAG TPA: pilus assembly protein TadG-related protein [Planctomycetaceae bacterium]|nr:pilus assembly protein TadG-related protein [Planctomycetaceae bacterium]